MWDFKLHQQREDQSLKKQPDKHMLNAPRMGDDKSDKWEMTSIKMSFID